MVQALHDELSLYEVERLSFHDILGFAAFYGCSKYILPHLSSYNRTYEDSYLDYRLACILIDHRHKRSVISSYLVIVEKLFKERIPARRLNSILWYIPAASPRHGSHLSRLQCRSCLAQRIHRNSHLRFCTWKCW